MREMQYGPKGKKWEVSWNRGLHNLNLATVVQQWTSVRVTTNARRRRYGRPHEETIPGMPGLDVQHMDSERGPRSRRTGFLPRSIGVL